MAIVTKYKPYEVKTPFHVEDCIREMEISDANGVVLAVVQNVQNSVLTNPKKFAKELCAVMRENSNALCHAANGEVNRAPMDDLVLHVGTDGVPFSREIKNHYENTKEDK